MACTSKKFAGRRKKEIRSYTSDTRLDIESGESIDYLRAAIAEHAGDHIEVLVKGGGTTRQREGEHAHLPESPRRVSATAAALLGTFAYGNVGPSKHVCVS